MVDTFEWKSYGERRELGIYDVYGWISISS